MILPPKRSRLDQHLVDRNLFASRSRARDAVLRGTVCVDGERVLRPAQMVDPACAILVDDPALNYVSRAALKLIAGLDAFAIDPTGLVCLDVGASTGGFTQVLLERGAARVHAIDVGHGQLVEKLRGDPRISLREGLNARDLTLADLAMEQPALVVADVSFISLKLALAPALDLAAPGARCVLLVKPQFEVGRDHVGAGGIVSDPAKGEEVAADLAHWLSCQHGWAVLGTQVSPLTGGDGNREFLLAGKKADV
jgi:23S rRNA (cytidine1920-2'-O)/16S rRNA (cytidine1409-2'-O)-methyltransferase